MDGELMVSVLAAAAQLTSQQKTSQKRASGASPASPSSSKDSPALATITSTIIQNAYSQQLSCSHTISILYLTAKLDAGITTSSPEHAAAVAALLASTQQWMYTCSPGELARLLRAAVVLQQQPHEQWLQEYCKVAQSKMGAYDAIRLAMTIWSLAKLAHVPSDFWFESFFDRCSQQMPR
jgi:hypothetical protein